MFKEYTNLRDKNRINNMEKVVMPDVDCRLHNWNIPKVPVTDIGSFKPKFHDVIRTIEKNCFHFKSYIDIPLLSKKHASIAQGLEVYLFACWDDSTGCYTNH